MEHFFLGLRYGVDRPVQHGWVAEWSKALVLGTSLFGGVGSNPTPVIILYLRFRRLLSLQRIPGS